MQNIIIFEGHDKSGKSTIAAELSKQNNIPIFKVNRSKYWWDPEVNLKYLTEGITQFIEQTGQSVILDRWTPSDYMYSKLFDRDISYRKIADIDARLGKLNALIVYCYKDKEAFVHDEEDKDFIDITMYEKMTSLYEEFAVNSKCRALWLNTSDQNLDAQLAKINSKLL
jgi:thymidylate kinase